LKKGTIILLKEKWFLNDQDIGSKDNSYSSPGEEEALDSGKKNSFLVKESYYW